MIVVWVGSGSAGSARSTQSTDTRAGWSLRRTTSALSAQRFTPARSRNDTASHLLLFVVGTAAGPVHRVVLVFASNATVPLVADDHCRTRGGFEYGVDALVQQRRCLVIPTSADRLSYASSLPSARAIRVLSRAPPTHRLSVNEVLRVVRPVLDGAVPQVRLAGDEDDRDGCSADAAHLLDPLIVSEVETKLCSPSALRCPNYLGCRRKMR